MGTFQSAFKGVRLDRASVLVPAARLEVPMQKLYSILPRVRHKWGREYYRAVGGCIYSNSICKVVELRYTLAEVLTNTCAQITLPRVSIEQVQGGPT